MHVSAAKWVFVVAVSFAVGGVAGYLANSMRSSGADRTSAEPEVREGRKPPAERKARPATVDTPKIRKLREKLASLEREFDELAGKSASVKDDASAEGTTNDKGGNGPKDVYEGEVLAKCKTYGDWKRLYPESWNKHHSFQVKRAKHALEKSAEWRKAMAAIGECEMSEEGKEALGRLLEINDKEEAAIKELMSDGDEMTLEREMENKNKLYEMISEGRNVKKTLRAALLDAMSDGLGERLDWSGEDRLEFSDALQAVVYGNDFLP